MNREASGVAPGYISQGAIGETAVDGVTIDDVRLELGEAL
jgi:hypothetical protein